MDLDGNLTRRNNAIAAGLPANFFVVTPAANEVNVTDSGAYSDYHALQIDLRRRLSKGLSASFQTTGFYDDPSNTYDPGGRLGQLMFRFNW